MIFYTKTEQFYIKNTYKNLRIFFLKIYKARGECCYPLSSLDEYNLSPFVTLND